jgi:hypothetical protein
MNVRLFLPARVVFLVAIYMMHYRVSCSRKAVLVALPLSFLTQESHLRSRSRKCDIRCRSTVAQSDIYFQCSDPL